jgi:hypothetical protein
MLKQWLLFVGVIFWGLVATNTRGQDELVNNGKEWNRWPNSFRSVYIDGFRDGQSHTYIAISSELSATRREALRLETFTFYQTDALRDVMTSLYSDPANTYIGFDSMIYVARDKLSGNDIEPMLRDARQHGRTYTRPPQ